MQWLWPKSQSQADQHHGPLDANSASNITIGDFTLELVEEFTYLGSTISTNLSLWLGAIAADRSSWTHCQDGRAEVWQWERRSGSKEESTDGRGAASAPVEPDADFVCRNCNMVCLSRIGLYSHCRHCNPMRLKLWCIFHCLLRQTGS